MCMSLSILAHRGGQRFVATCEHATLHLRWNHTMLLIHPESFGQLCALLDRRAECTVDHAIHTSGMGLYFLPNGMLQLWIAGTGLALQPMEAELLADMLAEAEALRFGAAPHAECGGALAYTREYRAHELAQPSGASLN